jgi:hypothetical protein
MLEKCEPDSPDRCQATHKNGQCQWKACEGSNYCEAHGGNKAIEAKEKEAIKNYQLSKWQARIDKKKAAPDLKNLRDEIAILRMMLEERLNACNSGTDLMLHSSAISDMVMKVEKVVASCHKLERNMGMVVDKQAILNFAGRVVQIITLELEGQPDKIDDIGNRILEEIGNIGEED